MTNAAEQHVLITKHEGTSTCRVCGSPLIWARTVAGRLMPLDGDPKVRALMAHDLRQRRTIRVAHMTGRTGTHLVKDGAHESRLLADGWRMRDELVEVWEIPASLTHFANCKNYRRSPSA